MSITRYIKVGKRTEGHAAILKAKGYEVEENEGVLSIQASEVVEGMIDLSTPEKAKEVIGDMITNHKVFSYYTEFTFADGKVAHGLPACGKLGKISALVTKDWESKKAKASSLNDIFDII